MGPLPPLSRRSMPRNLFAAPLALLGLAAAAAMLQALAPAATPAAPAAPPAFSGTLSLADAPPDVPRRLAKWKPGDLPFQGSGLPPREQQRVRQLVVACRQLESIYWRQSDPQALALYWKLAADPAATALPAGAAVAAVAATARPP